MIPPLVTAIDMEKGELTVSEAAALEHAGFGPVGDRERARAKQLGMSLHDFAMYRLRLRDDYANMFPPTGKEPRSALGMGLLPLRQRPTAAAKRAHRLMERIDRREVGAYCEDIADVVWSKLAAASLASEWSLA